MMEETTRAREAFFEVVGGSSKGGIIVRKGKEVSSEEVPERLSKGSLVKALDYEAGRIHYELVSGTGPASGWVSTHFHDKALLAKHEDSGESTEAKVLQWYSDMFAADEHKEASERHGRQVFKWATHFPQPQNDIKEELARELNPETTPQELTKMQEPSSQQLHLTFGYPSGTSDPPCFARFDIRDDVCRRFAGLRHGQVVRDTGAHDRELVVVGVKFDLQSGEERLWFQPQDLGRTGTVSMKNEDLERLSPVYKGLTQTIRKRVALAEASFPGFEAVEDSDGEGILLCKACRLPVGTSLYSDECGEPLHAECMAQRVQWEMREKEESLRQLDATKKKESRANYAIGWSAGHIPLNIGPAMKLSLDPLPRGMCCLMLQETSEGRSVAVVPTVDPASAVNLEYLSIALKVRYTEGREPTFSLDPVFADGNSSKMQAKCFEPKWLSGTSAGDVLFQADYHLKELSMGEYEQPIVGMKSCFDYSTWEAGKDWHAREWYVVRKAEMHMSEDNVLIPHLKMGVEAREQTVGAEGLEDKPITREDHPLVLYAQEFTDNFDLIAERKSVVNHLRELAKASLLAKFLLESEVQLEESWFGLAREASSDCHTEIPQLWNERSLAQIRVHEGKIMDSSKLGSPEHRGVYGGVKFGLDRFRLGGAVTSRPGLRAAPSVAVRAAMPTLSMSDVRSMGMLVASMQGKGVAPPPPPGEEVEGVPGAPAAARPSMAMVPGMGVMRPGAPVGPAPVRPAASAASLARQMQGMLVTKPGLDGRRARLDVPNLHGVDLNLDKFELDEAVRVQKHAPEGVWADQALAGANIAKAFWSSLGCSESVFSSEDQSLLKQVFNPCLSDRRADGDCFTPPDPSLVYVEKLRRLVKREEKVRQQRKEDFFSKGFSLSNPGPAFPCSWHSSYEISSGPKADNKVLKLRPDYLSQASMFDHVLKTAKPVFDKTAEDGLRFRVYKFGTLDVRTTQEHDGEEVIGAVFSIRPSTNPAVEGRRAEAHEKVTKVSEYVQAASKDAVDALSRRSYLVFETAGGTLIVSEKCRDGTITWEENPEDLEDRNSLARFIRSSPCSCSKKAIVTVGDIQTFKTNKGKLHGASLSACKRYVQEAFNFARGMVDRRDSGFGSKGAWHKGKAARSAQKETRKQTRKEEVLAKRAAARSPTELKPGKEKHSRKVIHPVVVGSWDDWSYGEVMAFDEQSRCYCLEMQTGDAGSESFQILCEGDWDMCLHPDRDNVGMQQEHVLRGPDADGHGKNWTIGKEDQAVPGAVYRILLQVDEHGVAQKVEWVLLGLPA